MYAPCRCRPQQASATIQQLQQQQQQQQQHPHLQFLQLAHDLADAAGLITTQYFRTKLNVDSKSDDSPVTIADRQAEEAMRKLIAAACPSHAVFGEEHGLQMGSSSSGDGNGSSDEWLWVLDPIDGTKSFITGGLLKDA
jgi:inositol-phosphate phosphatase/L-galactose 1-phosphate phosphatase/histidinol-phosphatase